MGFVYHCISSWWSFLIIYIYFFSFSISTLIFMKCSNSFLLCDFSILRLREIIHTCLCLLGSEAMWLWFLDGLDDIACNKKRFHYYLEL